MQIKIDWNDFTEKAQCRILNEIKENLTSEGFIEALRKREYAEDIVNKKFEDGVIDAINNAHYEMRR